MEHEQILPRIRIFFIGINHNPLNIGEPKRISSALSDNIRLSKGEHILFLESAEYTEEEAADVIGVINKYGFVRSTVGGIIERRVFRTVSINEVQALTNRLSRSGLNDIVEKSLIPWKELYHYYQDIELDRIRDNYKPTVMFETHSPEALEQTRKLFEQCQGLWDEAKDAWLRGEYRKTQSLYRRHEVLRDQHDVIRNDEITSALETLMKGLVSRRGGTINIKMGAAHGVALLDNIRGFGDSHEGVSFDDNMEDYKENPLIRVKLAIRQNRYVPLAIARAFLYDYTYRSIDGLAFRDPSVFIKVASNFDHIREVTTDLINSMSVDDLRRLCESLEDPLVFLKRQPEASGIAKYLTR